MNEYYYGFQLKTIRLFPLKLYNTNTEIRVGTLIFFLYTR